MIHIVLPKNHVYFGTFFVICRGNIIIQSVDDLESLYYDIMKILRKQINNLVFAIHVAGAIGGILSIVLIVVGIILAVWGIISMIFYQALIFGLIELVIGIIVIIIGRMPAVRNL